MARQKTSKVVPLGITERNACQMVAKVASDSDRVFFTRHVEERMAERRITRVQVIRCLRHGHLVEGPAPGVKGNTTLTLEVLSAGDDIRVVAALDRDAKGRYIVVITTYHH